jgi:AbrB family looped-hinge helix DNA binding protein
MALAQSRLTAQGQISVPVEVRKRLGVGPGSVIEWEQQGDEIVVRRAAKYAMEDLHRALFPKGPPPRKSDRTLRDGIGAHIRKKHASR